MEMYLKMGDEDDVVDSEVSKLDDDEPKAEFVGGEGEAYVPFASVYGLKGLIPDGADKPDVISAGPADEPDTPTSDAVMMAKKSNTTRQDSDFVRSFPYFNDSCNAAAACPSSQRAPRCYQH